MNGKAVRIGGSRVGPDAGTGSLRRMFRTGYPDVPHQDRTLLHYEMLQRIQRSHHVPWNASRAPVRGFRTGISIFTRSLGMPADRSSDISCSDGFLTPEAPQPGASSVAGHQLLRSFCIVAVIRFLLVSSVTRFRAFS